MLLGVDFDNTIVCYDQVFHQTALEKGLIPAEVPVSKDQVRNHLRERGLEDAWTELQGIVYGPRIQSAPPFPGVLDFLARCRQQGIPLRIISHKTTFSKVGVTRTNLRTAALGWMAAKHFFETEGLGLSREDVLFGATRQEKIEHIRQSGCTHFIDDLEEVFLEETFPANVEKILFAPNCQSAALLGVTVFTTWQEINEHFFGATS